MVSRSAANRGHPELLADRGGLSVHDTFDRKANRILTKQIAGVNTLRAHLTIADYASE